MYFCLEALRGIVCQNEGTQAKFLGLFAFTEGWVTERTMVKILIACEEIG